jgi:hypothetical protein
MDREASLKLEARLSAIEFYAAKIGAALIVSNGGTVQTAQAALQNQLAREQTFPTLDPVMSDLASAELNEALERLLRMQVDLVAQMRGESGPQ